MRIAYFISNRSTIPPAQDQILASANVVLNIIKHLKSKHQITLYAAKGSFVEGVKINNLNLSPFYLDASLSSSDWITKATLTLKQIFIGQLFKEADQYDIIHLHTEPAYLAMPFVSLIKTPVLFTIHNEYHQTDEQIFKYFENKVYLSALSQKQANLIPWKNKISIIYNGIDIQEFPFNNNPDDYFLFLGRLVKDKGAEEMIKLIEIDRENNYVIIGTGQKQYEQTLSTLAQKFSNVIFINKVIPHKSKKWFEYLKNAKALVSPITWNEPFGLVFIEAMACGTPVIAYNNGSVAEIINNNSGFVLNEKNIPGLLSAIHKLNSLDKESVQNMRESARTIVESKFTSEQMAAKYEQLYYEILSKNRKS